MSLYDREIDKIWNKLSSKIPQGEALLDEASIGYLSTQELWELQGRLRERLQISFFWQPKLIALVVGAPIIFLLAIIAGISGFGPLAATLLKIFPWCVGLFVFGSLALFTYTGGQKFLQDKLELIGMELRQRKKEAQLNSKRF